MPDPLPWLAPALETPDLSEADGAFAAAMGELREGAEQIHEAGEAVRRLVLSQESSGVSEMVRDTLAKSRAVSDMSRRLLGGSGKSSTQVSRSNNATTPYEVEERMRMFLAGESEKKKNNKNHKKKSKNKGKKVRKGSKSARSLSGRETTAWTLEGERTVPDWRYTSLSSSSSVSVSADEDLSSSTPPPVSSLHSYIPSGATDTCAGVFLTRTRPVKSRKGSRSVSKSRSLTPTTTYRRSTSTSSSSSACSSNSSSPASLSHSISPFRGVSLEGTTRGKINRLRRCVVQLKLDNERLRSEVSRLSSRCSMLERQQKTSIKASKEPSTMRLESLYMENERLKRALRDSEEARRTQMQLLAILQRKTN